MLDEITKIAFAFNNKAETLKLGSSYELAVNPNWAAVNDVMNVDLKSKILPGLMELRGEYNRQVHRFKEELIVLKDQQATAEDTVAEKKEHLARLSDGIKGIEAEVDEMQGEDNDLQELLNEKKNVEKEIGNSKADHLEHVARLQFDVDSVKAEYEEKKAEYAQKQKTARENVNKAINLIATHKTYIHENLVAVEMNTTQVQAALQKAM